MSYNKTEKQLISEAISGLKLIIQFLNNSSLYQHQTLFMKNLQSMVDGKNKISSKGSTVKTRILESLKIAMANTPNLQTQDGRPCLQQDKVKILDDCMKLVTTNIKHIPDDVITQSSSYLLEKEKVDAALSSTFFKHMLTNEDLFTALVMGKEELAEKIVRAHPDLLFKKGTYKIPLLNEDGSISAYSEQVYHNVTPLKLMFYIGDWQMEQRILPLISDENLEEVLKEKKDSALGGPDLVKIDRDPSTLSVQELRYFHLKNRNGQPMHFSHEKPINIDLLHNRNGIFCHQLDNQIMELYYVDIHPETQVKTVTKLSDPQNMTPRDQNELNDFKSFILNNIAMNSSIRSSDYQHTLIKRLFGITLERSGIHYTMNCINYQDTYNGCVLLKNIYRRGMEFFNEQELHWNSDYEALLIQSIGMAQRFAMPHVMQIFCKENLPCHPLPQKEHLECTGSFRDSKFYDNDKLQNLYPLHVKSGLGFNFLLTKMSRPYCLARNIWSESVKGLVVLETIKDFLFICMIDEVRKEYFNDQVRYLEQRLERYNYLK